MRFWFYMKEIKGVLKNEQIKKYFWAVLVKFRDGLFYACDPAQFSRLGGVLNCLAFFLRPYNSVKMARYVFNFADLLKCA